MAANCPNSDAAKLYHESGISPRHQRGDLDDSPPEWLAARKKLIGQLGTGFLIALVGRRGPGKTQLAQQLIMQASAIQKASLYARAMTMIIELQTANSQLAQDSRQSVVGRYVAPDLLVVDECQERGETDFENRMLNHIIDFRYGEMRDTLLIANLTPEALQESIGESIADRLRETGGIMVCDWPSFRQKESTNGTEQDAQV
ncbi:MAG: ATP-binding protein [Thermoguttaceae bacterium]